MSYPDSFPAEKYQAYATLRVYKKRIIKAMTIAKKALDMNINWYTTCSCGKDSTVLSHLICKMSPGIEVWSEKDCFDFPGEREYLESLATRYKWNVNIVSPPDKELTGELGKVDFCEDIHSRGTSFSDTFFYKLITEQESKFDGVFLGLRCEESQGRLRNFKKRGHIYQRKNGKWTCNPLSTWKAEDIFAYLVSNEIPILPVYFNTAFVGGDPGKIRKSWYLPSARAASGHCVWLKYYYPELYQKLLEMDSGVSSYT